MTTVETLKTLDLNLVIFTKRQGHLLGSHALAAPHVGRDPARAVLHGPYRGHGPLHHTAVRRAHGTVRRRRLRRRRRLLLQLISVLNHLSGN